MGRVSSQIPAEAQPLMHFTHPHELHPDSVYPQAPCSGCKLQSSGIMYTCKPCNFTLHQSCAKLPHLITHPSHQGCNLSLLATSSYAGGIFNCDACGRIGDGWSYNCTRCEYDLHVTCASKPLKIKHQAHITCDLHLTFKNPYMNSNGFSCDICGKIGSQQWLYRCNLCEFDVHLDCTTVPRPVLQHHHSLPSAPSLHHHQSGMNNQVNGLMGPPQLQHQPHLMHSATTGGIGNNPYGGGQMYGSLPGNLNNGNMGAMQNNRPTGNDGFATNMMMAALQGLVEGAAQGVGQAAVQEVISGGGGGEYGDGGDDGGCDNSF